MRRAPNCRWLPGITMLKDQFDLTGRDGSQPLRFELEVAGEVGATRPGIADDGVVPPGRVGRRVGAIGTSDDYKHMIGPDVFGGRLAQRLDGLAVVVFEGREEYDIERLGRTGVRP